MKTKTTVQEVTYDELVNLFSTAMLGNYRWSIDYDDERWNEDTLEGSVAAALLGGDTIFVYDNDADGDAYGVLPHFQQDDGSVRYNVMLCDIMKGVENIMDSEESHLKKIVCEWTTPDESGDMDIMDADALLQFIVFGELIYG